MKLDVDKLLSEGWSFFYLGKTKVLSAPNGSPITRQMGRLESETYNGECIYYFKYHSFPWEDYIKDKHEST